MNRLVIYRCEVHVLVSDAGSPVRTQAPPEPRPLPHPSTSTPATANLAHAKADDIVLSAAKDLAKGAAARPDLDIARLQDAGVLPKGHLEPNATYHAGPQDRYTVKTDTFGRLKSIEGTLVHAPASPSGTRSSQAQLEQRAAAERGGRNVGRVPNGDYDLGFHLVADRFGVEGAPHTLVPGNADLNNSDYKRFENGLDRHVQNGSDVHLKVSAIYNDRTNRPAGIAAHSTVDGEEYSDVFRNEERTRTPSGEPIVGSTRLANVTSLGRGSEAGLEGALKFAKGAETVGRVAAPIALAADVISIGNAYQEDGGHIGRHTSEAVGSAAGGWAGAAVGGEAGAELGATIGSIVPGAGTVVGGVVGGLVGGAIGGFIGSGAGAEAGDLAADAGHAIAGGAKKAFHAITLLF